MSENTPSKYAWRELPGVDIPSRPVSQRIADFFEVHGLFDEATAREQASRCIQCPNPSCVSGCPLCNPIPQWMQLTAEGRFLEAAAVLGSVSNMAEICARVCPSDRLCEGNCILDSVSKPVSIRAIEQFLADYAFKHGLVEPTTAPPNGLRVAVIGSGPGPLACADELAQKGYSVTLFDSALLPGGLMVNGIPAFRLDRSLIQRRLSLLQKRGVTLRFGVKLWDEITLESLRADFAAVFLGFDARVSRTLAVPAINANGVIQALPFLLQKTTAIPLDLPPIDVAGKRVVVIGGGDTAIDCLRMALRYGAKAASGIYRRVESAMPSGHAEYHEALEEGARYLFEVQPVAILTDSQNQVTGIRLVRTERDPASGAELGPVRVRSGTEHEIPADLVIQALGFDPAPMPALATLKSTPSGRVAVDAKQMTSIPGVFAGGDLTRGPSNVLQAVRDARVAADEIRAYLKERAAVTSP